MSVSSVLYQNKLQYSGDVRAEVGGQCDKAFAFDEEGKKVMIKGQPSYNTKGVIAEWFCAWLAERIGLKTNKVTIINSGEKYELSKYCSMHYWLNDFKITNSIPVNEILKIRNNEKNNGQYLSMQLFDKIIENDDRHEANYGYDENGDIIVIDHEMCHPWNKIDSWDKMGFKRFFKNYKTELEEDVILRNIAENFLSISKSELVYLLIQLPYEFYDVAKNIIHRMMKTQKIIRKHYKQANKIKRKAA